MSYWLGLLGAGFMGMVLGLMGGGGSILTVPILVYILHIEPVLATSYSLFVVGTTSLVGSLSHFRSGNVNLKAAFAFALPAFVAVFLTRHFLLPVLPAIIFQAGPLLLTKNLAIMVLFACLMVAASVLMIHPRTTPLLPPHQDPPLHYPVASFATKGFGVGMLTSFVGAGGGFLITPALVLLARLPMKRAIGTSLVVIALNSLVGFTGDLTSGKYALDFRFLLSFTGVAVMGILLGVYLNGLVPGHKLKPAFGWFVLVMGLLILGRELL